MLHIKGNVIPKSGAGSSRRYPFRRELRRGPTTAQRQMLRPFFLFRFSVKMQILESFLYFPPALRRYILAAGVQPEFENTGSDQKRRPGDSVDPGVGFVYFQMLRPAGRDSLHGGVEDVSGAKRCPREDTERTKRRASPGRGAT